ncbi:hypothetical protein A3762_09300 [Oleiphilus sp. HI0125]|uniref:alpha/beta hydrolase n=1 Tax=Oleiphilus sp. HI0125 TaxID=1822266 RepID=UPI0007C2149D|nr:alpha/beta fold hydrolase [Oleiphilus sp. HI0125]KZZ57701.1 hypothetical protein A3762_09300 [Oleiphilus sp. HI0125]
MMLLTVLVSCIQVPQSPSFAVSPDRPPTQYISFQDYLTQTKAYLTQNRAFISDDPAREIEVNMPFELRPSTEARTKRAILLVHGLGDSPYSFIDLAPILAEQGFVVRTILLAGHGTRPADLLWASERDWQKSIDQHAALLKKEFDEVWLGGLSTGANLVTSVAFEDESINGLLLYAPAFHPTSNLVRFSSFASYFIDWVDIDPEENIARYDSLTAQAAASYYATVESLNDELARHTFDRPAMLILSEADSVVDSQAVANTFHEKFTYEDSRLIWFGEPLQINDARVHVLNAKVPEMRVSSISHMRPLFSPMNPYYGEKGEYRHCNNGQGVEVSLCQNATQVWYSAYGYQEAGKLHARLTFNPHFNETKSQLSDFLR